MSVTVLTVDDSASLRMAIRIALTGAGCTVTEAADGVEGLQKASSTRFDIIVTDLNMPNMDGSFRIRDVLRGLRIFALSIQIAASDDPIFISLSHDIRTRVEVGEQDLAALTQSLNTLEKDIVRASEAGQLLAGEVQKAVPAAPMQLAREAEGLEAYQGSVVGSAKQVAAVARSIQGKVAAVLGALQIGDITRQRLEHVAAGLALLEAKIDQLDGAETEVVSVKGAVVPLLIAQLSDTGLDFCQQSRILTESLEGVAQDAGQLSEQQNPGEVGEDPLNMLARLEGGIARVAQLTKQLCATDALLQSMSREIVATVDELGAFLRMLRKLRADVEQISINTGIRCYRAGPEGRAVAVIAVEVRSYVGQLDEIIESVGSHLEKLNQASVSLRPQDCDDGGAKEASEMLEHALLSIRSACGKVDKSTATTVQGSGQVTLMLDATTSDVGMELEIGGTIDDVLARLAALGAEVVVPVGAGGPAADAVLEQIAALYTMARERDIHRGYAQNPLGSLAVEPCKQANTQTSDDDLFDDVLF